MNPVQISPAARAVLDAGRELWRYYHAHPHAKPNASYYDIRRHLQGMKTTAKGKEQMNLFPTYTNAVTEGTAPTLTRQCRRCSRNAVRKVEILEVRDDGQPLFNVVIGAD